MEEEIWKDIKGYEGLYQVSSFGRIKSLPKHFMVVNQFGKTNKYRATKERILKPQTNKHGYLCVTLCKNGIHKLCAIHRLVAKTFIENKNNHVCINHKDENKQNNKVDNLEWCTIKYNQNYGTIKERVSYAQSIDVAQYDINGDFIKRWHGINKASRELNINHSNIISCCQGKRRTAGGYMWRYVDGI